MRDWPPQPMVEDEIDALAKEHLEAHVRTLHLASAEPPFRGSVDQHPIILEANIPTADAIKPNEKPHTESTVEDSGERRFILIPRGDTRSPVCDDESPRRSDTATQTSKPTQNDTVRRDLGKPDGSAPPRERRRSRQDLPSLQTEMPPFRRSTSAYAYSPTSKQSVRTPRTSGDFLLSPDAATSRGQPRGNFDTPPKFPARPSHGNIGMSVTEKRRSGGQSISRPTTPTTPALEKRSGVVSEINIRSKQDLGERSTRLQLSPGGGTHRSERAPSAHSHLDPSEYTRQRKSSNQSNRNYYSSDDGQDSSDSDRRRRRHYHRHQNSLRPDDGRDRHHRSGSKSTLSSNEKAGSRIASPFASPNVSPSQLPSSENLRNATISGRGGGRPIRRPDSPIFGHSDPPRSDPTNDSGWPRARSSARSRRSSPVATPGSRTSSSALPIQIPTRIDPHFPSDARHSLSVPQYEDDSRSASNRRSASPNSPRQPPFQPLQQSSHLDQSAGSYRRYSQDVNDGNIVPLPPCPRTTPSRGYNDWLTLPQAPSFNICPSCFESAMASTEFRNHFVAAPTRSSHDEVLCDFGSQPWYRIAWLLTRKERRRDLSLMSSLANIAATTPPCLGKHEALRKWYSIIDPETGHPIRNFDVCLACRESIVTLLPSLRGIFVRIDQNGPSGLLRVCDMRFDSKRFIQYFDAFEMAADSTEDSRYTPDTSDLVDLVRRYASIPECPHDQAVSDSTWYIITQLPEFTVCRECFDEVVQPYLEKGKAIPSMFNMQRISYASCQLYSPRMRGIFREAVDDNDYKFLASKARERRLKELQFKKDMAEQKRIKGGEKEFKRIESDWAKWE